MPGLRRFCVSITALCFLGAGFSLPANAGIIGTETYLAAADRAGQMARVQAALARDEIRSQLVSLGVDPDQAAARVAHLTERELALVAGQLEELPAGGDALAVIGIVFLVLLILELTGVIDIFKRI